MVFENHMEGFWGPVTGADFCEFNYANSYYIGEFWDAITSLCIFPMLFIILHQVKKTGWSNSWVIMNWWLMFIDVCCGSVQHVTMSWIPTRAQDAFLGGMTILWGLTFYKWHAENCELQREFITLIFLIYGASLLWSNVFVLPGSDVIGPLMPLMLLATLIYVTSVAKSTSSKLMMCYGWAFTVALSLFTITDRQMWMCDSWNLPVNFDLHCIGHLISGYSNWCIMVWLVVLYQENEEGEAYVDWYYIFPILRAKYAPIGSKSV